MKSRRGFVSNSSTSSFLIYGCYISNEDRISIEEQFDTEWGDLGDAEDFPINIRPFSGADGYNKYLGRSWDCIGDNQTGAEFKQQIKQAIEKLLSKTVTCSTHEEAWRDG